MAGFLLPLQAFSSSAPGPLPEGKVTYAWLNDAGKVTTTGLNVRGEWKKKRFTLEESFERPVFEVRIEVPATADVHRSEIIAGQGYIATSSAASDSRRTIVVNTISPYTRLHLDLDERGLGHRNLNLLITISNTRPLVLLDKSCENEGVELQPGVMAKNMPSLYIGAVCSAVWDKTGRRRILAALYWSSDLKFTKAAFPRAITRGRYFAASEFEAPKNPHPFVLGRYLLSSTTERKPTTQDFAMTWAPPEKAKALTPKRWLIWPSLGLTSIAYSETAAPDYSEIAMTGKLNLTYYWVPERWDVGLSSYLTLAGLSSNLPGVYARFLGINARVGYHLPSAGPWSFSIYSGIYYNTMMDTNGAFGFSGMMGPLLYPILTRNIGKNVLLSYFKYSPVTQDFSFSLSNRELAGGLGISHPLSNEHAVSVNLDYANQTANLLGTIVNATSISLSVGYSL